MQLTERDLRVLRLVADYRYMTREQVERLEFSPTTSSYCKRRLSLLYHNGHLNRRFLPLRDAFGAARAYYSLDSRGAGLVREIFGLSTQELDWRPRDTRREALFMEHTLKINDFRVLATLAAQAAGLSIDWIDERALKRLAPKHRVSDPRDRSRRITIVPDGYFVLAGRWAFALELDRGTVERVPFARKVRAYGEWKVSGAYERAFGTESLRVLFVVDETRRDPARLRRIKGWTEEEHGGSLFWFANLGELTSSHLFDAAVWWMAASQEKKRLMRPLALT
jgi:hypothetical protein